MSFTPGMNRTNTFTSTADPELRKFIIYVPASYQPQNGPYPVVYMLHGTGQTALKAKNNTNWNRAADTLGFIVVYPEALPYLLTPTGPGPGVTVTKWHTNGSASLVDPTQLPMADDVTYLRELHNSIGGALRIDCSRIYATGFSNGGGFVKTMLRVHLSDIFAATTSAGGLGMPAPTPSDYHPTDGFSFRPHFEVTGNRDSNRIADCVATGILAPGQPLPMQLANIVAIPCMWDPLTGMADVIGMDPAIYTSQERWNVTQIRWDFPALPGPGPREYRWHILRGLTHEYPSGTNYPIDYVPIFYRWMSKFTL
jgi:dienelactone hydrolase